MQLKGSKGSSTYEVLSERSFALVRKKNKLGKNAKEIRMCQNP